MTRATFGLILAVVTSAGPPQFRARAEVVPIYATARSADGHLVTDLQASDFEILERGTPVPVAVFSNQPQPITLAMLVDMSGGIFSAEAYPTLRKALDAFVDALQPLDRA